MDFKGLGKFFIALFVFISCQEKLPVPKNDEDIQAAMAFLETAHLHAKPGLYEYLNQNNSKIYPLITLSEKISNSNLAGSTILFLDFNDPIRSLANLVNPTGDLDYVPDSNTAFPKGKYVFESGDWVVAETEEEIDYLDLNFIDDSKGGESRNVRIKQWIEIENFEQTYYLTIHWDKDDFSLFHDSEYFSLEASWKLNSIFPFDRLDVMSSFQNETNQYFQLDFFGVLQTSTTPDMLVTSVEILDIVPVDELSQNSIASSYEVIYNYISDNNFQSGDLIGNCYYKDLVEPFNIEWHHSYEFEGNFRNEFSVTAYAASIRYLNSDESIELGKIAFNNNEPMVNLNNGKLVNYPLAQIIVEDFKETIFADSE